jgi:hypothetical protein
MTDPLDDPEPEDDGKTWGYMVDDQFRALPKRPLLLAGFTRAPFDVTLPSGDVRHIVEAPTQPTRTP